VIVLVVPSAGIDVGFALTDDWLALTAPAVTVTVAVCVIGVPPAVAVIVLPSALVELKDVVTTPLPFVVGFAGLNVFPDPVELNVTGTPGTGLPLASRAVTVIVLDSSVVIVVGLALTVD
jgi:hypothetical protein